MEEIMEQIIRRRMHGLYLSRQCEDISQLSQELMGLHCWFHRNVVFSALIRGAELTDWKNTLTKTWIYRGTLHGVVYEDLPLLLALHAEETSFPWLFGEGREDQLRETAHKVVSLMEDGVFSRAEMRRIFADEYDQQTIDRIFSPWGGIFVYLARLGKVAFRNMTSRDFDLIAAEPTLTQDEVLPELLRRFFTAYGPATLADATWFLGLGKDDKKKLAELNLEEYLRLEYDGNIYYSVDNHADLKDIPELTLLSGFDPFLVSYAERSAVLPPKYKSAVVLKSGICNPTIVVNGQVAGIWNIKKKEVAVTFFNSQPKRIVDAAHQLVENIQWKFIQEA